MIDFRMDPLAAIFAGQLLFRLFLFRLLLFMLFPAGFIFTSIGCTTLTKRDLATGDDYKQSLSLAYQQHFAEASRALPTKETGGFIHTLEKGYLELLAANPKPELLLPLSENLDSRKTLRASNEVASVFYKETEEGYFPSEHEIVWFHIVSALSFAAKDMKEQAAVETRKAAGYLQTHFAHTRKKFDDPGLRLLLVALFNYLGQNDAMRVELKNAIRLNPALNWIEGTLFASGPEVKSLHLTLAGIGPVLKAVSKHTFHRLNQIRFDHPPLPVEVQGTATLATKAQNWYERHQQKNLVIADVLQDSRYFVDATPGAVAGIGLYGFSTAIAIGLGAATLGVSYHLYARILQDPAFWAAVEKSGWAGLVLLGPTSVLIFGLGGAMKMHEVGRESSLELAHSGASKAKYYRVARFLPDYILAGLSQIEGSSHVLNLKNSEGSRSIHLNFLPIESNSQLEQFEVTVQSTHVEFKAQLIPKLKTFQEAVSYCKAFGEKWELADTEKMTHFHYALDKGTYFNVATVWAVNPRLNSENDECNYFDMQDGTLSALESCGSKRSFVCVRSK